MLKYISILIFILYSFSSNVVMAMLRGNNEKRVGQASSVPKQRGAWRSTFERSPLGLPLFQYEGLSLSESVDPVDIRLLGGQSKSTYAFYNGSSEFSRNHLVIKSWDNYHMAVNELLGTEVFKLLAIPVPSYKLFLRKDLPLDLQNICSSNDPLSLVRISEQIDISPSVLLAGQLEKWPIYASFLNFFDFHQYNYVQSITGKEYLLDAGGSLLYKPLGHKKNYYFNFQLLKSSCSLK